MSGWREGLIVTGNRNEISVWGDANVELDSGDGRTTIFHNSLNILKPNELCTLNG